LAPARASAYIGTVKTASTTRRPTDEKPHSRICAKVKGCRIAPSLHETTRKTH